MLVVKRDFHLTNFYFDGYFAMKMTCQWKIWRLSTTRDVNIYRFNLLEKKNALMFLWIFFCERQINRLNQFVTFETTEIICKQNLTNWLHVKHAFVFFGLYKVIRFLVSFTKVELIRLDQIGCSSVFSVAQKYKIK